MKEKEFVEMFKTFLINKKNFPPQFLSSEKQIKNVRGRRDLCTRFDLIAFHICFERCLPLVLFELKRSDLFIKSAVEQIISYNRIVCAPFMCVATPSTIITSSKHLSNKECLISIYGTMWISGIPDFNELVQVFEHRLKIT